MQDALSTDLADLEQRGFSPWSEQEGAAPSLVVFPESTEDVIAIVNAAREHRVPLLPYAGGTAIEGHWFAPRDKSGKVIPSIPISFEKMADLLELDEDSAMCRVQPGLGWQDLNEELASRGSTLFWPIDPGPGAQFGGMLEAGGSGTGAVRYGTMKGDLVLNVTVVLPSGEVIKTRSDARKSAAGPDLTKLFLGSEGTLGVITEATLRLVPRLPEAVITVPFDSLENAVRAVNEMLLRGVGVSAVELLDEEMIKAINTASKPIPLLLIRPSLFIKFAGSPAHTAEDQRITLDIISRHGADMDAIHKSKDPSEVESLWESRKIALWNALQVKGEGHRDWRTDVCVPIAKLPELVKTVKQDLQDSDLFGPIVGHFGDGNLHAALIYKDGRRERDGKDTRSGASYQMVRLAQDLGGTCTGEHGVGRGKREYLERELGSSTMHLHRSIKKMLDPTGFMNPGALLLPEEQRGESYHRLG